MIPNIWWSSAGSEAVVVYSEKEEVPDAADEADEGEEVGRHPSRAQLHCLET